MTGAGGGRGEAKEDAGARPPGDGQSTNSAVGEAARWRAAGSGGEGEIGRATGQQWSGKAAGQSTGEAGWGEQATGQCNGHRPSRAPPLINPFPQTRSQDTAPQIRAHYMPNGPSTSSIHLKICGMLPAPPGCLFSYSWNVSYFSVKSTIVDVTPVTSVKWLIL